MKVSEQPATVLGTSISAPYSAIERSGARLYRPCWRQEQTHGTTSLEPTTWMLFMDPLGLGRQISIQLGGADHQVIEVSPGKSFTRVSRGRYLIRPGCRADYDSLITDVAKRGKLPQKIVHLWCVTDTTKRSSIQETLDLSFVSLQHLMETLREQSLTNIDVAVISNRLQSVEGEPLSEPIRATLLGPVIASAKNFPGTICRSVDCDPVRNGLGYVAVQVIAEHCSAFRDPVVAYRADKRWVQGLESIEAFEDSACVLRDGVYLITGGLQPFGLGIAETLAQRWASRLILLHSAPFPQSTEWGAPTDTHTITLLNKIQATGGQVLSLCADLSKRDELKNALEIAREKFGRIDGVIHAGAAQLQQVGRERATDHLRSTIEETLLLYDLLGKESPDFLALFPSLSLFEPETDQIHRAATDAFLNAFATSCGQFAVSINGNWDAPTELNNSADESVCPSTVSGTTDSGNVSSARNASQNAEIFTSILSILSSNLRSPVTVCTNNSLNTSPAHRVTPRPGSNVGNADIEETLLGWWRDLLGIDNLDLDDDFFELGGHSLVGVQLFSKIHKFYGLQLGLATLFEARTARQMAQLIRKSQKSIHRENKLWSPLVPIQLKGARLPLYVISGLGGNVVKFYGLAFHLGEDQPMYGLLPRGMDGKEAYRTRVEDIAADYVKAIREFQRQGPYQLVGYSFGGVVAFEVAHQIVELGERVEFLGFLDTIEWRYGDKVDKSLRPGERFDALIEQLRAIVFNKDRLTYMRTLLSAKYQSVRYRLFELLRLPLPHRAASIEEVNYYAGAGYHPKTYRGKLTLFRSTKRSRVEGDDEHLGWGRLVDDIEVHHIPSTHFNLLKEPAVKIVADKLRLCLERRPETSDLFRCASL